MLNSLVDGNGRFSKSGEVHFSRKTYSFVIADSKVGFNAYTLIQNVPPRHLSDNEAAKLFIILGQKKLNKKSPFGLG